MNNNFDLSDIKANLKKARPWHIRSFYKNKYESELENQEFLSAVYEISKKFDLTNPNNKKKFYEVAYKHRNIKNISELEGKMICELVSQNIFFPWVNKKEHKSLKTWFKDENFTAVAKTENILKNIFSMHRVQNFDPIKAIRNMKDKYNESLGNGEIRVLSNQEIRQLLDLDLDDFMKENDLKKIMPFDYENLSDVLKLKIKAEYLFNAVDSYCSGSNMSENDILQSSNDLNKFYYLSQSYAPKFFSKQNAGRYKAIFDNMVKNIDKIHLSLEKVKTDKAKRQDSITNLDIFDTLVEMHGFKKIDGESPAKYKFIGTDDKSMELPEFQKGEVFDSDRLMNLIPPLYKNIESFRKLNFENEKLAAVTFLEHPEKIGGISFSILSNTRAKTFWNNVFDFMKLDNKYKDKKPDIIKAIYSLPDTSTLKQEFIKSKESIALLKDYLAKKLKLDFDLEKCFSDKDFKEIVTNGLVLKNILLASRAANKHPLEFIESQKNTYMENHEGQELSNSEIKILLDFDILNDDKCKKVLPINTNNLPDDIKNDISGEYVLNALKAYASEANTFTEDPNYLNSNPDKQRIFYLVNGDEPPLTFDAPENIDYIKDKKERNDFYGVLFNLMLENYSNIDDYLVKHDILKNDATEVSEAVKNCMLESKGKEFFTKMFKRRKGTIVDKKTGKDKVVDLIDILSFAKPYCNSEQFQNLHTTNSKLACVRVLIDPKVIADIEANLKADPTMYDIRDFSNDLIDIISKQESYKSKIPEILSYLDSESEMAKNIFDLAVKKNIYNKIELKSESDIKKPRALTVDLKNKNTEEKSRSLTIKNKKAELNVKKVNPLSGKLNNVQKLVSFFEGKSNKNINKQSKKIRGIQDNLD